MSSTWSEPDRMNLWSFENDEFYIDGNFKKGYRLRPSTNYRFFIIENSAFRNPRNFFRWDYTLI